MLLKTKTSKVDMHFLKDQNAYSGLTHVTEHRNGNLVRNCLKTEKVFRCTLSC